MIPFLLLLHHVVDVPDLYGMMKIPNPSLSIVECHLASCLTVLYYGSLVQGFLAKFDVQTPVVYLEFAMPKNSRTRFCFAFRPYRNSSSTLLCCCWQRTKVLRLIRVRTRVYRWCSRFPGYSTWTGFQRRDAWCFQAEL